MITIVVVVAALVGAHVSWCLETLQQVVAAASVVASSVIVVVAVVAEQRLLVAVLVLSSCATAICCPQRRRIDSVAMVVNSRAGVLPSGGFYEVVVPYWRATKLCS